MQDYEDGIEQGQEVAQEKCGKRSRPQHPSRKVGESLCRKSSLPAGLGICGSVRSKNIGGLFSISLDAFTA